MAFNISCPVCKSAVSCQEGSSRIETVCQQCQTHLSLVIFSHPEAHVSLGTTAARLTEANEASCYNHSSKQAVCGCDSCGKLLCSVCDMAVENKHFCPDCVISPGVRDAFPILEVERLCEEKSVWFTGMLGVFPPCVCCFFTVPVAILLSAIFWGKPGSLLRNTRSWMIGGILIGLIGPVIFGLFISFLNTVSSFEHR